MDSPEQYAPVAAAAWFAIGVYAIGLFVFNGVLLLVARKAIVSNKPTTLSTAIRFLYKECARLRSSTENKPAQAVC